MPTPRSGHRTHVTAPGYWNYSYGHQNPILHSCLQRRTNPTEQYLDGMPPPYGFHNLNRQSLFLADDTQHSYFVLPENYCFERATSSMSTAMSKSEVSDNYQSFTPLSDLLSEKETLPVTEARSICDVLAQIQSKLQTMSENLRGDTLAQVKDELEAISENLMYESMGHSCEMILDCTEQKAAPEPLLTRGTINEFNDLPVYDVYEYVTACRSSLHPTVNVIEVDTEEVEVKVDSDKPSISPERPTDGIFSFTNEKKSDTELLAVCFNNYSDNASSDEATHFALAHGPVIHDERSVNLTNENSTQAASILSVQEATVHCVDERSEIKIKKQDVLINKHDITSPCDLNNDKEVPFVLQYHLPLNSAPCIWDPGIDLLSYKKLHHFIWILLSAIPLLQQLHKKNISSMWEFYMKKGRQVQWDPGIKLLLYELWCLKTLSKETGYTMRHLLAVKFGPQNSTYFIDIGASMCCPPTYLIQKKRNIAAMLQFWRSIFNDTHCCQIFQKGDAMSSQFHWNQGIEFNGIAIWLITFNPP